MPYLFFSWIGLICIALYSPEANAQPKSSYASDQAIIKSIEIIAQRLEFERVDRIESGIPKDAVLELKKCAGLPDTDTKQVLKIGQDNIATYLIELRGESSGHTTILGQGCRVFAKLHPVALIALSHVVEKAVASMNVAGARDILLPSAPNMETFDAIVGDEKIDLVTRYISKTGSVHIRINRKKSTGSIEVRNRQSDVVYRETFDFKI